MAHRWLAEVFQPTIEAIPEELRRKLEPAQLFHEVLDHRWYLSETAGGDVGLPAAVKSYVDTVLVHKPDEKALLPEEDQ
ncbi:DUF4032 domain-containing protein [Nonomuraea recticatena]|uniref:DUF4032 domain-containing protein n=1 Tax=Nonomuraea recticatena TaxID=46178 RepID=UPI0036143266